MVQLLLAAIDYIHSSCTPGIVTFLKVHSLETKLMFKFLKFHLQLTDRQTDRQRDRQTNKQTDRETDRQTNRQTEKLTKKNC